MLLLSDFNTNVISNEIGQGKFVLHCYPKNDTDLTKYLLESNAHYLNLIKEKKKYKEKIWAFKQR